MLPIVLMLFNMLLVLVCLCFLSVNITCASSIITRDMILGAGDSRYRFGRHMTELRKSSNISKTLKLTPEKDSVKNSPVKVFQPVLVHLNKTPNQTDYLLTNKSTRENSINNENSGFITKLFSVKNGTDTFKKYNVSKKSDENLENNRGNGINRYLKEGINRFQTNLSCTNKECGDIFDTSYQNNENHSLEEPEDVFNPAFSSESFLQQFKNQLNQSVFDADANSLNNLRLIQEVVMNSVLTMTSVDSFNDRNLTMFGFFEDFINYFKNFAISKIFEISLASFKQQNSGCNYNDHQFYPASQVKCNNGALRGKNIGREGSTGYRRIVEWKPQSSAVLLKLKLLLLITVAVLTSATLVLLSGGALSLSSLAFLLLSSAVSAGQTTTLQRFAAADLHANMANRFQQEPYDRAFYMR